jgi:hypothetical protein
MISLSRDFRRHQIVASTVLMRRLLSTSDPKAIEETADGCHPAASNIEA